MGLVGGTGSAAAAKRRQDPHGEVRPVGDATRPPHLEITRAAAGSFLRLSGGFVARARRCRATFNGLSGATGCRTGGPGGSWRLLSGLFAGSRLISHGSWLSSCCGAVRRGPSSFYAGGEVRRSISPAAPGTTAPGCRQSQLVAQQPLGAIDRLHQQVADLPRRQRTRLIGPVARRWCRQY